MKTNQNKLKTANRVVWQQRFEDWQASGLSKVAYCKQKKLKLTNFYSWCYLLKQDRQTTTLPANGESVSKVTASTFIPLNIQATHAPSELKLQCGDITLSCADTVSPIQLTQWIQVLRTTACLP